MARLNLSAVLLAGGLGTRIRQLFPDIPKPMIPLAGIPVMEWIVRLWALQGVRHFVLSTGYLGDRIERHFTNNRALSGLHIECVREAAPLGTGGAVAFAQGVVPAGNSMVVGNADSLSAMDIRACFGEFETRRADVLMGTAFRDDTAQFGSVELGTGNRIMAFREKVPGPGVVNAGVYLMRRLRDSSSWKAPVSMERDVFPKLLAEGALFVAYPIQGEFLDIGTPAGYAAAEQFLQMLPDFEAARNFRCE